MAVNPFANAIKQAAEQTDMNESQSLGEWTPPAEGLVRLRFVGYIEIGKHDKEYNKQVKQVDYAILLFEASGPKHPRSDAGVPIMFTVRVTKSLNEKAGFYKLFKRMNPQGTATHFAELLGNPYLGTVVHNVVGEGENKRTYANLKDNEGVWTIREPYIDVPDPETGDVERRMVSVDEPVTPLRCFLWDYADKTQWDSLFIDGMTEERKDEKTGKVISEARTKNIYQEQIKKAHNWQGSIMQEILFAGGEADIPDAEKPSKGDDSGASGDPLEAAG